MSTRRRWPFVVATIPLWTVGSLLLAASYARLMLGHWPAYNQPDPAKVLPLFLDVPPLPLGLAAPIAALASSFIAIHGWYTGRADWWRIALTAIMSFLVLVGWVWLDPAGLILWWAD